MISSFKSHDCEIFVNVPLPPDFNTFWKEAAQQGFKPKLATVAKVLLFPADVQALGSLVNNIATDSWWSPFAPYKSSLTGETAAELALDYQKTTGQQWTQAIGSTYAAFEIAQLALTGASDPHDHQDVANELHGLKYEGMNGVVDFASGPAPGVAIIPAAGVQWKKGKPGKFTDFPYAMYVVDNSDAPSWPINGPWNRPTPEAAPTEVAPESPRPDSSLPERQVPGATVLELDRVTKRFGRVPVADELCLEVRADELIGVVGPNGAGKTSLFSIISGDLAPDRGRVVFRGRLVNRLDAASRCRLGIGRTYQVPRPFEQMTVFENVLVAAQAGAGLRRHVANDRAFSVLEETGLARDANRRAGQLGLLDRKRLELARALATGPRLLLLDEVAAGLTDPEVDQLIAIVRRARASSPGRDPVAVIWVEHVVRALASTVDRLICLDEGVIIADDPPEAVLANPRVKEVYLGTEEPWVPDERPTRNPATLRIGEAR